MIGAGSSFMAYKTFQELSFLRRVEGDINPKKDKSLVPLYVSEINNKN